MELGDFSSKVVEFPSMWEKDKAKNFVHSSSTTDALEDPVTRSIQTNQKFNVETQTTQNSVEIAPVDDKKLAIWLRKIYSLVETELSKGITPIHDSHTGHSDSDITIKPYQKISDDPACNHGYATWLSLRTNDAPLLALATSPLHTDWCDHVGASVKVYTPRRASGQDFVVYSELAVLPVKSCIKSLSTNKFNKDMFVGGTFTGDIYIWEHSTQATSEEIKEVTYYSSECGSIIAVDWLKENELLTCHSEGNVLIWKIGKEVIKDKSFKINNKNTEDPVVITAVVGISPTEFILGTEKGQLLHCSISKDSRNYHGAINPVINELESHYFSVTSLVKTKLSAVDAVISCDLSGEVFFYDIRNSEDGPTLIVKMPLPFKNCISCSKDGDYIFSPGIDGSLDVFKVSNGMHSPIDGNLAGKGTLIKISDNGSWIVTGLYKGTFQIFKVMN